MFPLVSLYVLYFTAVWRFKEFENTQYWVDSLGHWGKTAIHCGATRGGQSHVWKEKMHTLLFVKPKGGNTLRRNIY